MPGPPEHPYLVCATQRSGSTLLCETLRATGVAGRPLEHFQERRATGRPPQPREYFDGVGDPDVLALLAPTPEPAPSTEPAADWWARVLAEGSGDNGVWGGKLMWDQVPDTAARFGEVIGRPGASLREGVDALLGHTELIFVTRPDRVDQAVSLWKAVQTRQWRHDGSDPDDEPVYSFAGIRHLTAWLEAGDQGWRAWFEAQGIEPLTIDYDTLSAAPADTVQTVLDRLGVEAPGPLEAATSRQADARSQEWARRYRHEAAEVRA